MKDNIYTTPSTKKTTTSLPHNTIGTTNFHLADNSISLKGKNDTIKVSTESNEIITNKTSRNPFKSVKISELVAKNTQSTTAKMIEEQTISSPRQRNDNIITTNQEKESVSQFKIEVDNDTIQKQQFNFSPDLIYHIPFRYTLNNFESTKTNFKNRFISENIKQDLDYSKLISSSSEILLSKNSLQGKISEGLSINNFMNLQIPKNPFKSSNDDDTLNKYYNNTNELSKNLIKVTGLYLQYFQKGVLLFNNKKYEESYKYLISHKIIKSIYEFAEILLVTNDFDKDLIGNLLAKNNLEINNDYILCKIIIKLINYDNTFILDSLRFLLEKINLPIDSSAIMKILEIFSNIYYEDNKQYNNFKDSDSIYLLCNTILALNTMLMRRDLNINIITMKEFISMNEKVNQDLVSNIYTELEKRPLDLVYNYNEIYNKRLTSITRIGVVKKESTNTINTKINNINLNCEEINTNKVNDKSFNTTINNSVCIDELKVSNEEGGSLITMLRQGNNFIKYGNNKYSRKNKFVFFDSEGSRICWKDINNKCSLCKLCSLFGCNKIKYILIKDIIDVYYGTRCSKCFEKYDIKPSKEPFSISIETKYRTLDLQNESIEVCKKWFLAIKFLIQTNQQNENPSSGKLNYNLYSIQDDEEEGKIRKIKSKEYNEKEFENKLITYWEREILYNWDNSNSNGYSLFLNSIGVNKNYINLDKYRSFDYEEAYNIINKYIKKSFSNKTNSKENNINFYLIYIKYGIPSKIRKKVWDKILCTNINFDYPFIPIYDDEKISSRFNFYSNLDTNKQEQIKNEINNNFEKLSKYLISSLSKNDNASNIHICRINSNVSKDGSSALEINNAYNNINNDDSNIIILKKINKVSYSEKVKNIINSLIYNSKEKNLFYSKNLLYFTSIFLLVNEDEIAAYKMINCILNHKKLSFILYILISDINYLSMKIIFFDQCFEKNLPKLYKHFKNLGIETHLFFNKWLIYLYIKYFLYKNENNVAAYDNKSFEIILKIFDILFIKGEVLIYEIGIALLSLLEKKLLNLTNYHILKILNHFPYDLIGINLFFNKLNSTDLTNEFIEFQNNYST